MKGKKSMGEKIESKREKFVRLAEARTTKIIGMVRLLGNLSNKRTYDYDKEDVKKIFNALEEEIRAAKMKFDINETDGSDRKFSLK